MHEITAISNRFSLPGRRLFRGLLVAIVTLVVMLLGTTPSSAAPVDTNGTGGA
jgi:hypothetical protein